RVPHLVLPLSAAGRLRHRVHGDQGVREHLLGSVQRTGAVRHDLPHYLGVHPLRQRSDRSPRGGHPRRPGRGGGLMGARQININELTPGETVGSTLLNMVVFAVFIVISMTLVLRASKSTKSTKDFYTGGSSFTGPQNGFAIAGDYLSAASFLGIAGAIAVNGYDGFLYSIGFLVAWLVALLLV